MRSTAILLAFMAISLIAAFAGVAHLWSQFGLNLSLHGWIAYGLGCTASIALAAGLFHLSFKSSREGYDNIDRLDEHAE